MARPPLRRRARTRRRARSSPPSSDILARWGERDRAKALLRGSIDTLEGGNKAVAQGNLATLLKDEGKLAEALATYEADSTAPSRR